MSIHHADASWEALAGALANDRAWDALADALDAIPTEALPLIAAKRFDLVEWARDRLTHNKGPARNAA